MLNIFIVHSHITFLSALAVIQQLSKENNLVILTEGYKNELLFKENIRFVKLPESFDFLLRTPSYGSDKFIKLNLLIVKSDLWLFKITKGLKYNLFLPHTKNFFYQVFVTQKRCYSFSYLDEGLLSYTESFHKDTKGMRLSGIKKYLTLNYLGRVNIFNRNPNSFEKVFRFVNTGRFVSKNEKLINWPILNSAEFSDYSGKIVLILDNPINGNVLGWEEYRKYLIYLGSFFQDKIIFIKHHPRENNKDEINKIFDSLNLKYLVIKNDEILEFCLALSKSVKIYGGWSSLLFYGNSMGHDVTSFLKTIKQICPSSKEWIDKAIPEVFYKTNINLI